MVVIRNGGREEVCQVMAVVRLDVYKRQRLSCVFMDMN